MSVLCDLRVKIFRKCFSRGTSVLFRAEILAGGKEAFLNVTFLVIRVIDLFVALDVRPDLWLKKTKINFAAGVSRANAMQWCEKRTGG